MANQGDFRHPLVHYIQDYQGRLGRHRHHHPQEHEVYHVRLPNWHAYLFVWKDEVFSEAVTTLLQERRSHHAFSFLFQGQETWRVELSHLLPEDGRPRPGPFSWDWTGLAPMQAARG